MVKMQEMEERMHERGKVRECKSKSHGKVRMKTWTRTESKVDREVAPAEHPMEQMDA
jgi:hypothetical protein